MLIIGIAGGTGSGKSAVSKAIEEQLGTQNVALLSQDSYYVDRPHLFFEERANQNYDHPDAFENTLLVDHLQQLHNGQPIQVPVYDFTQHRRTIESIHVNPRPVIIVEGLLILAESQLRQIFDIKVYVDTDADTRILNGGAQPFDIQNRTIFERIIFEFILESLSVTFKKYAS